MTTRKQVEDAMNNAIKTILKADKASQKFDRLAGKYFEIDDFSSIYQHHDELVDPLQYATGNITWKQLCKSVNEYKQELKEGKLRY